MLNVMIICVGKLKEKFWTDACNEYAKRLKGFCNFSITEVDEEKLPDTPSPAQIQNTLEKEGQRIIAKIPKNAKIISMCIEGKQKSSEKFAKEISDSAVNGASTRCIYHRRLLGTFPKRQKPLRHASFHVGNDLSAPACKSYAL